VNIRIIKTCIFSPKDLLKWVGHHYNEMLESWTQLVEEGGWMGCWGLLGVAGMIKLIVMDSIIPGNSLRLAPAL
jgi:hypothetical protein